MSNEINKYDLVQYKSYSYPQSQPMLMHTLGQFFGMHPADITTARVLELGCASGGNIYPLAEKFPKATFVGIDSSERQIEHGKEIIKTLGLKNITLKRMSITDINKNFGTFDYIICHGVFSWVNTEVQNKILKIFQNNLNKQGIGYISYNTLPGWNMLKDIRDLMLYHTQFIDNPKDKVAQAKSILKFVVDGLANDKSAYAKFLSSEVESILNKDEAYLYHDYLEDINDPIYFHNMIENASKKHLSYLSDVDISSMHPLNLNQKFIKTLAPIKDLVQLEQYMDFIRNRRFRCSLFCHDNVKLHREITYDKISQYYLMTPLVYTAPFTNEQLIEGVEIEYRSQNAGFKTKNLNIKTFFKYLIATKQMPVSYPEILEKVASELKLEQAVVDESLRRDLNLVQLLLSGLVRISGSRHNDLYTHHHEEFPQTYHSTRYQLRMMPMVTNGRHEMIKLNIFEVILLSYLDGKHSIAMLEEKLLERIQKGEIKLRQKDTNEEINSNDVDIIKPILSQTIEESLRRFAILALLVKH